MLLILFISRFSFSQELTDDAVYDKTIDAVGLITDRSGAWASGFFINENTFITNYHVTDGLDVFSAKIKMKDDREYSVKKILREHETIDLAIIQIEETTVQFLELDDDSPIRKNDHVVSIGNPTTKSGGINYYKMTAGRIKKIEDEDWYYTEKGKEDRQNHSALIVQHTAIIKEGNSGGPLINSLGKVVGINTFFYDYDDSLNYAVHVNELIGILKKSNIEYNNRTEKYVEKKDKRTTKRKSVDKTLDKFFDWQVTFIEENFTLLAMMFLFSYATVLFLCFIISIIAIRSVKKRRTSNYYFHR